MFYKQDPIHGYSKPNADIQKNNDKLIKVSFMRYFLTFSNTPVSLASFPEMYKMWSFHYNLLSMMTPKDLVLVVLLMVSPSILIRTLGWVFLLGNIMKCVFLIFKKGLFAFNHNEISFNS